MVFRILHVRVAMLPQAMGKVGRDARIVPSAFGADIDEPLRHG